MWSNLLGFLLHYNIARDNKVGPFYYTLELAWQNNYKFSFCICNSVSTSCAFEEMLFAKRGGKETCDECLVALLRHSTLFIPAICIDQVGMHCVMIYGTQKEHAELLVEV